MIKTVKKIVNTYNKKNSFKINSLISQIDSYKSNFENLSDKELKSKTFKFKRRLSEGSTLDEILPEAFALVREASKRVLGLFHYKVQLIGGIILHQGNIAEMKTGEGKTLVATLPIYLNALSEKGVHIITVNDYLAKRDFEWMGKIYNFLGLSVGLLKDNMSIQERQSAYDSDITFGTNKDFGFDYLRDNMAYNQHERVQRSLHYAVIDEIDSILIDEARTPLIISGPSNDKSNFYQQVNHFISSLTSKTFLEVNNKEDFMIEVQEDYIVTKKPKNVMFTQHGIKKAESYFNVKNLYDSSNITLLHHINQALQAHALMKKDVDYIVQDNSIIIVDSFTGRLMSDRKYSNGMHQALEAKENVTISDENKTIATITFQNYFRMYKKLSGLTGTAKTEESEFEKTYGVSVVEIPTNKPIQRIDNSDWIFQTLELKYNSIINKISSCYNVGRPVLVGTTDIDKSEFISKKLSEHNIPHNVLNAKNHSKEAEIIANAGKLYAVTIATNMAGRGTDIIVEEAALKLGGLLVIGTERHESRRIDNQLIGRTGRQGDPGESRFYLSMEDKLLSIHGKHKIDSFSNLIQYDEEGKVENKVLNKLIEKIQKIVESQHYKNRNQTLEYDDIINKQRQIVYKQREQVLLSKNLSEYLLKNIRKFINDSFKEIIDKKENISVDELNKVLLRIQEILLLDLTNILQKDYLTNRELSFPQLEMQEKITDIIWAYYEDKKLKFGTDLYVILEKTIFLKTIDDLWINHIDNIERLKQGISLRVYGQKDLTIEFSFEAYEYFSQMIDFIKYEVLRILLNSNFIKNKPQ